MKKYLDVDILSVLEVVVEKNTTMHKEDFNGNNSYCDTAIFTEAAENSGAPSEERTFLWISREHGTNSVLERRMLIKDTAANSICQYYAAPDFNKKVVAYIVEITGLSDTGRPVGNLYPIDNYPAYAARIAKAAVQSDTIRLTYEKGELFQPAEKPRNYNNDELGKLMAIEAIPNDPRELETALQEEREQRRRAKVGSVVSHLAEIGKHFKEKTTGCRQPRRRIVPAGARR